MFLLDKYQWLKIFNECPTMIQYVNNRPKAREIAKDTADWLLELFSFEHQYDSESLKIFERRPDLFEDFVLHEIFEEDGSIEVVCPKGMSEYDRSTYEFVTAFFLFVRHRKMFPEHLRGNLKSEVRAFFSSLRSRILNSNLKDKEHAVRFLEQSSQLVYEKFYSTSFVYNVSKRQSYVYNGINYVFGNSGCVRLELNIVIRDDENNQKTFGNYINYLLLKERNRIIDFKSSTAFWNNSVKLEREHEPYLMEQRPVANKDLLLFSLALALSKSVYEKLIKLRDESLSAEKNVFEGYNNVINSPLPFIDDLKTKKTLFRLLDDSYWLLENARNKTKNERDIPRQILLIANIHLLNEGCYPIISLEGREIKETASQVNNNNWRKFYNQRENQENQLTLKSGTALKSLTNLQ